MLGGSNTAVSGFSNKYAIDFDGVDDHIEVADAVALRLNASDASWSFWVKLDSLSGGDGKMIAKGQTAGAGNQSYQIRTDNADLKFQFYYPTVGWRTVTGSSYFTSLDWVHVVVTMQQSTKNVTIYKNGSVFQSGTSIGYPIPSNTGELMFGCRANLTNFLSGMLDEVGIFNTVLSAGTVTSIYNSGTPASLEDVSGLVGWWRMGDPNGTAAYPTIIDQSTNSNNGTMTNMVSGDIVTTVP